MQTSSPPTTDGSPPTPKHRLVFEHLRRAIRDGAFIPGQQLPTETDLVEQFGVSRTTITRALRDLETQGVVRRRRGSGTYVRERRKEEELMMGMIIPGLEPQSIFGAIYERIVREAEQLGYGMMTGLIGVEEGDQAGATIRSAQRMIDRGVCGVIYLPHAVAGPGRNVNHQVTQAFRKAGVAVVLMDREIVDFPDHSGFDLICTDNLRGGTLLAEHLIHRGCRRIAFISQETTYPSTSARLAGCQKALMHHGRTLDPDLVCRGDPQSATLVQDVMSRQPDGIICDNDGDAALVMRHLLQAGVSIPGQVKLAGFDDTPTASLLTVPLTTVRQPTETLARKAMSVLRDRLEHPDSPACRIEVDCELIIRESTGS